MVDQRTEQLRAQNDVLERQVGDMLAKLEQQQRDLEEGQRIVSQLRVWGESDDRMVKVQVDAVGAVLDVVVAPEALRRSTPELLGAAMKQAAHRASASARVQAQEAMAPVLAANEQMPDLPDLVPGAPSLHDLFTGLDLPEPAAPGPAPRPAQDDDEDDGWGRSSSFMEDPRR
ncbi:YbaB/EbfC family nucleoid-associated protein [Rhodococcus rhodnii]|uniref:Uncharacterized protein n=1 Tax=Rhodococcus rhodnii LMG 5362 TaxID=1273125 RepID=R7WRZ5_9NOCA|nr:YbaB/EbfC family nucleoid-associated protein [Rhodococcus rhodnii]EOM78081.1 hypothetical protein Rrhod_0554 [Rhodococcus rhodnii LMG 5362]